jgi:hypothetical protein
MKPGLATVNKGSRRFCHGHDITGAPGKSNDRPRYRAEAATPT